MIQQNAGLLPYEFNPGPGPLGIWMFVSFARKEKRGKCSQCGQRRVLFVVHLDNEKTSPGRCARCAGIR